MTQLESAKQNKITPLMEMAAKLEGVDVKLLCEKIAAGRVVIPGSLRRSNLKKPCGIGEGLRTKVNANIGTSLDLCSMEDELEKLRVCIEAGADTVMDLSTGGDIGEVRRAIIAASDIPVGTVPVYEAVVGMLNKGGSVADIEKEELFSVLSSQAEEGVDFFTIHCGINLKTVDILNKSNRTIGVVSRGGAFLIEWMRKNGRENPFYEDFDRVIEIAREFDIVLSLGDGMRPGAIADATDSAQIEELMVLGELANQARMAGVQVIIEGPGHIPLNQIKTNVLLQKQICKGAPFYVLGPLVTDVAPGYDHITAAIGGAAAAGYGADFLCYVTASEHLRLPSIEDVRTGVIACRIAAHAGDIAKGIKGSVDWDNEMSRARCKRDWKKQTELAIDSQRVEELRETVSSSSEDVCTMCGELCSIKMLQES